MISLSYTVNETHRSYKLHSPQDLKILGCYLTEQPLLGGVYLLSHLILIITLHNNSYCCQFTDENTQV